MIYSEGTKTDKKIGPFRLNRCYYTDCVEAMKKIPENSIEMCLTDPNYNVNPKNYKLSDGTNRYKENAVFYDDNMSPEKWEIFCRKWFVEARRLSEILVFTPGEKNLWIYSDIEKPRGMLIHNKPDCQGNNTVSWLLKHEHIYVYGDGFFRRKKMPALSCVTFNVGNFKTNKVCKTHWCPKSKELWMYLLDGYKPSVVIDPFLGSGTTAECCEELGIPWLGFEIKEEYKIDIDDRIETGMRNARFEQRKLI